MEEEKGIKDNVEEDQENLQAGQSLTAGAEARAEGSMVLRTEDLFFLYLYISLDAGMDCSCVLGHEFSADLGRHQRSLAARSPAA